MVLGMFLLCCCSMFLVGSVFDGQVCFPMFLLVFPVYQLCTTNVLHVYCYVAKRSAMSLCKCH
jgi:hypothetical protein